VKRAAGVVLVLLTLLIAYGLATRADDHVDGLALEKACGEVLPGDSPADVFARLGLGGYRSGCGEGAPCETATFGPHADVPYLCDGDDCSLYWREGPRGCLVEWTRGAAGVDGATLMRLDPPP